MASLVQVRTVMMKLLYAKGSAPGAPPYRMLHDLLLAIKTVDMAQGKTIKHLENVQMSFQGQSISTSPYHAPFCQNGAKSGFEMCFGPSTLGAGAKTRLESRIKKFTPHRVCRPAGFIREGNTLPGDPCLLRA